MDLVLVGLNHKTAPIEIREKVAFREESIPLALESLLREFDFDEAMIDVQPRRAAGERYQQRRPR